MKKYNIGDKITVKVNGEEFDTVIHTDGVQRFIENSVIDYLFRSKVLDMNRLHTEFRQDKFTKRDYMIINMMLGYSVGGFADLSVFQDWEIENPVWAIREDNNEDNKEDEEDNKDLSVCEQCEEKTWDGRICYLCGAKNKG